MSPLLARSLRLAIVLAGVTLGAAAVVLADQGSHSVSDTFYVASPALLVVALSASALLFLLERQARRR